MIRKFVNFVNAKRLWFAVGNIVFTVAIVFVPVFYSAGYSYGIFSALLTNILLLQRATELGISYRLEIIIYLSVVLLVMLSTAIITFFLRKKITALIIPSFATIIGITFLNIKYEVAPHIGFYLSLAVFAFYLFYLLADTYYRIKARPAKPPKPRKLTDTERIEALEAEIERLKKDE